MSDSMRDKLVALYGSARGTAAYARLMHMLDQFRAQHPHLSEHRPDPAACVSERDVMLITYGDSLQAAELPPLQALYHFLTQHLSSVLSAVHILPFFPFSSDDGFAVIDYATVPVALAEVPVQGISGYRDLLSGARVAPDAVLTLGPYQVAWLKAE